jgi:hypothetical protein
VPGRQGQAIHRLLGRGRARAQRHVVRVGAQQRDPLAIDALNPRRRLLGLGGRHLADRHQLLAAPGQRQVGDRRAVVAQPLRQADPDVALRAARF